MMQKHQQYLAAIRDEGLCGAPITQDDDSGRVHVSEGNDSAANSDEIRQGVMKSWKDERGRVHV